MPDFEKVFHHARTLAALTDPARQEQRQVVMWPVEVAEHWEALARMWRDPARDQAGTETQEITAATIAHDRNELERIQPITIDARFTAVQKQETRRKARCGNCGARYEITEDPTENHHTAMRHARICPRRAATAEQNAQLMALFERQPMQQEFSRRAEEMIRRGVDPVFIRARGVDIFDQSTRPRRWWQFWKWFR